MEGVKMIYRVATRATAAVAAVAFLLAALGCEEESEPGIAPSAWVTMAVIPGDYAAQAIGINNLSGNLAAGSYYDEKFIGRAAILRYRAGEFRVEFMSENDVGHVIIYDMDAAGRYAVGTYETYERGSKRTPYMVAFDPSYATWSEVPLGPVEEGSITQVVQSGRACWLLIGTTGPTGGRLYKYKGEGVVEKQEGLPYFASVAASPTGDTVFGAAYVPRGRYSAVMSFDGGSSWRAEEFPFIAPGFELMSVDAGCATAEDLYFCVRFVNRGAGIIRRHGSFTDGEYELVFYTPKGDFKAAAADEDGRLMAVGPGTSVVFDGANWQIERLPYPLEFRSIIPVPGGGFLALANNEAVWQREILYHR